jgi:hypothetical protein
MYRIDDKKLISGVVEVNSEEEAKYWNEKNWGIFYTPNTFNGARRAENIVSINSWYVDIDEGKKEDMLKLLYSSPALPCAIVETKNGYHAYWFASDATIDNWYEIEDRLIYHFKADSAVRDLPRLLRKPNFYHCKGEPFLIKTIHLKHIAYTEKKMLYAFKKVPKIKTNYKTYDTCDFNNVNLEILLKPNSICKGARHVKVFKKGVFLKRIGATEEEVDRLLNWLNSNLSDPLEQRELDLIVRGYSKWTQ